MTQWVSRRAKERADRYAKMAMTPSVMSAELGLPDNHVITVNERSISIDDTELVQNNVRTDTFTLDLDKEWDGINPVVIFGSDDPIQVAYDGSPVVIPAKAAENIGGLDVSVCGLDAEGNVRVVTKAAHDAMNVVESGLYVGSVSEDDQDLLGQILQAKNDAASAATAATSAAEDATDAAAEAREAADSVSKSMNMYLGYDDVGGTRYLSLFIDPSAYEED